MWTKKNNKGAKITKKSPILKGVVSTDKEEVLNIAESTSQIDASSVLREIACKLLPLEEKVLTFILDNPALIKPNGKFNVRQISFKLGLTWYQTKNIIEGIARRIKNDL